MRVLHKSQATMDRKYGEGTLAHVGSKGTVDLGPSATGEDLEHEKAHYEVGFTGDLREKDSYKRYIKEEVAAWLRVGEKKKLNTEFVWRVASNALDYKEATPKKVLDEISRTLKSTEYKLSRREKKWLLKMLKAVEN